MLVKSKFLGAAGWKDLSAKNKLKDDGLAKALEKLGRTGDEDHDDQTKVLEEVVKLVAQLKKDKAVASVAVVVRCLTEMQGDAELTLRDVAKAKAEYDKAKKAKAEAEKAAAKKAPDEDEDDDEQESPELLTTKLKPLLKLVAKGDTMHALLAKSGKQVVVMLSRKPIPPARRKVLAEQLGGGSTKYYPGTCGLEAGATTFALKAEVAGMSKLVKTALLQQTGLRINKIKCRGDDGDDHDDDGPPDEAQARSEKLVARAAQTATASAFAPLAADAADDPAAGSYGNADTAPAMPQQSSGPDARPIGEPDHFPPSRWPTDLVISPQDPSVYSSDAVRFSVTAEFSDNTSGPLEDGDMVWSSSDQKVLSIDSRSGKGTARDVGKATVIATWRRTGFPDYPLEVTQKTTLTVKEKLTELTIRSEGPNDFKGELVRGERMKVIAYGLYAVGAGKVLPRELPGVVWSSSDETVLEIKGGLASALKAGSAMISADDEASGANRSITVRVTEPAASPAADPSAVPADIAQPYRTARQGYDNLMQQVRELDDVPRLVKSLNEIIRDLSHAQEDTVAKAQMAEQQNQQIQGIQLQINNFAAHAESAKTHIQRVLEELDLHQIGLDVAELRSKGAEEIKNIEFALSLTKVAVSVDREKIAGNLKAAVELVSGLVKRFHVSAWTTAAEKLQRELDARKHKLLLDNLGDAKKELGNARQALTDATSLASKAAALFNRLREDAENKFDAKAGAGSFKFTQITKPLEMADKIVDQLVPALQRDTETVNAAYTKLKRSGGVDLGSPAGKNLQSMNDEALGWWKQAANVGRQADEHRKRLRDLRQQANTKLAFVKPGAGSGGKP